MGDMNITLRAVEPEDADFMYDAESDQDAWKYSDYVAPLSRELLRNYALTYDADPLRAGQIRFIIEKENLTIGIADLFEISARHLRADTGLYILPAFRGNGLGVKAIEALEEYSRERLGLHQLTASVAEKNHAARKMFSYAGFISTGMRKEWLRMHQGYEDVLLYCKIL